MLTLDLTEIDRATTMQYLQDFFTAMWYFHQLDKQNAYDMKSSADTHRITFRNDECLFDTMPVDIKSSACLSVIDAQLTSRYYEIPLMR